MFLLKICCPSNISNILFLCITWKWPRDTSEHVERKFEWYVHDHVDAPRLPFNFLPLQLINNYCIYHVVLEVVLLLLLV